MLRRVDECSFEPAVTLLIAFEVLIHWIKHSLPKTVSSLYIGYLFKLP